MCPIQDEIDESYMGENFEASKPVTNEAIQLMHSSFTLQVKTLEDNISQQIQASIEKAVIQQIHTAQSIAPLQNQFQGDTLCISSIATDI